VRRESTHRFVNLFAPPRTTTRPTSISSFGRLSLSSVSVALAVAACGPESKQVTHDGGPGGAGAGAGSNAPSGGTGIVAGTSGSSAGVSNGTAGRAGSATGTGGVGAGGSNAGGSNAGGSNAGGSNAGGSNAGGSNAGSLGSAGNGGGGTPVVLPALVTSAPGAYWKTDGTLELTDSTASADVTVDDTATAQQWEGFGAAFNERGWSFLTTSEMQKQAMALLFSARDGAAFAWGRIPIGANDFALSRYTLDDTGADVTPSDGEENRPSADISLDQFSLARDGETLIPYVKAAKAVKPDLRFWASPWTPPVWMKTGYRKTDGWNPVKKPSYFDGGSMKSDPATLSAYAHYFTKFVQGYEQQGIDIELVAPQEEPYYEQSYPSCMWDKATYTSFVGSFLGPAMQSIGVKVMLGTLADRKDLELANAVIADSSARPFSALVGLQWDALWYQGEPSASSLGLPIWATEHKGGNYPWNPSGFPAYTHYAPNDQAYGVESWGNIRDAIRKTKVTSYNAWNLVLDSGGWSIDTTREWAQNALLVADAGSVTPTPAYYVFRHLSQYVIPGATVLGTSGGDALAFENPDGSVVAVMFNSGVANSNYVVAIRGKRLQFAMPANGWATVKYKP